MASTATNPHNDQRSPTRERRIALSPIGQTYATLVCRAPPTSFPTSRPSTRLRHDLQRRPTRCQTAIPTAPCNIATTAAASNAAARPASGATITNVNRLKPLATTTSQAIARHIPTGSGNRHSHWPHRSRTCVRPTITNNMPAHPSNTPASTSLVSRFRVRRSRRSRLGSPHAGHHTPRTPSVSIRSVSINRSIQPHTLFTAST